MVMPPVRRDRGMSSLDGDDAEIQLQSPPTLPKAGMSGVPQLMMFLPMMLGMGAMSFVYIGRSGGVMTYIFGALFVAAMGGMIVMTLVRGGQAKKAQINEERRDYQRYLDGLRQQVRTIADSQLGVRHDTQPDPDDLWEYTARGRLWERKRSDTEFGRVRIGTGPQRLGKPLRAPQTVPLEDLDPVSSTSLRYFIRTYATVPELPVAISLRSFAGVTVSGDRERALALLRATLCQLAIFHSPNDMRVALCLAPDRMGAWEWTKWLPHVQASTGGDATGPRRLVAADLTTLADLLGADLGERPTFTRSAGMGFDHAHIVLVVDGGRTYGDTRLGGELGHHAVTVLDVSEPLPGSTAPPNTFRLHIDGDKMGMLLEEGGIGFVGHPDGLDYPSAEALARRLTALHQPSVVVSDEPMSSTFGLSGLLGIGDPRDLDPGLTWRPRTPRDRLRIPLGVDPYGQPVALDLKESAEFGMGPHGLVIGATGSGKSELLRTLVSGMAVTHSSESLNLALIDFKGGATFAGMSELPHTCAVITNLADDLTLVDRMGDAIRGEVVRRQELLRAAGNYASVRDYEAAREAGADLAPLPSLLVIIDEFSELLSSRPEFIDLFVMIGRLGRSLAIHLLLASQRLEEGRLRGLDSHLSYRIGLRTFSASESRTVLGVPDAYQLPSIPGSAYLKIDTDTLIRFKAAYVSGVLPPREVTEAEEPENRTVLPFALPTLHELSATDDGEQPVLSARPDPNAETIMGAMVSRLIGKGPPAHQIWLPPLKESPTLEGLLPPLGLDPDRGLCPIGWGGNGKLTVPLAIVDKPFEQRRDLLWADFSGAGGNAIVVGAPQSGKSTLLRTLIGMLSLTHTPSEVQIFCLDMGGGALSPISGLPHVSGYATRRDVERCRRIVAELTTLLDEREQFFTERGIDSIGTFRARRAQYVSGEQDREFGDVFLVVDDWTTIKQDFEALDAAITSLAARGLGFGIHVIVSVNWWMGIRTQIRDSLGTKFELRLGDPAESAIDRRTAMNVPSGAPGRGLTTDKLHFLAALPRIDGEQNASTIGAGTEAFVADVRAAWQGPPAPSVRLLPRKAPLAELPALQDAPEKAIPLGLAESDLAPVWLDFGPEPHFIAFADVECGKTATLRTIAKGLTERYTPAEAAILVVDYRRGLLDAVSGDHLLGYAGAEPALNDYLADVVAAMKTRLPGPDITPAQLRAKDWWSGPDLFVIVDDYELVATSGRNPLTALLEFLPQSRDIGLHLIIARGSGGAARAIFEPVVQRLRELGSPGMVMSGTKDEGALLGDVKPSKQPPGRGYLVSRRTGTELVQIAWTDPDH